MVQAGIIAFILVAVMMICRYRLPGTIAVISLLGQVAATLAVVSGYFTVFPGSTLTLPGIAGIILGIGMGVDANVITCLLYTSLSALYRLLPERGARCPPAAHRAEICL